MTTKTLTLTNQIIDALDECFDGSYIDDAFRMSLIDTFSQRLDEILNPEKETATIPLTWIEHDNSLYSETPVGNYYIIVDDRGIMKVCYSEHGILSPCKSLDEGKIIAEEDFKQRILKCIAQ